ncbi:MAG: hypothetical protein GX971_02610, partial [Firmicutes bacterium]|nr:hypothetical protein [Bacillota bacterium]
ALPEAVEAILHADVVVLGPGSLYTSIIPNLLIPGFVEALNKTSALVIYVCNVMTQPGETDGYSACDHVQALLNHTGSPSMLDYVLVNRARISEQQVQKYAKEGAHPVQADVDAIEKMGIKVHSADVLDQTNLVRHASHKLAEEILYLSELHNKQKVNGNRAV